MLALHHLRVIFPGCKAKAPLIWHHVERPKRSWIRGGLRTLTPHTHRFKMSNHHTLVPPKVEPKGESCYMFEQWAGPTLHTYTRTHTHTHTHTQARTCTCTQARARKPKHTPAHPHALSAWRFIVPCDIVSAAYVHCAALAHIMRLELLLEIRCKPSIQCLKSDVCCFSIFLQHKSATVSARRWPETHY